MRAFQNVVLNVVVHLITLLLLIVILPPPSSPACAALNYVVFEAVFVVSVAVAAVAMLSPTET
eukprot:90559-Pyramimonas_sp.AAC.1